MTVAWYRELATSIEGGEPTYRRCPSCDAVGLAPRRTCPGCGHPELEREPLSTDAEIVTWTTISNTIPKFSGETPYTVVIAEFPEGVRLTGQFRSDADRNPEIGDPVALTVEPRSDDDWLIVFRDAGQE